MTVENVLLRRIRVRKEDSAFVYCLFESYEGIVSYSTVDYQVGDRFRDLELTVPQCFDSEVDDLINHLGDLIYERDFKK